MYRLQRKKFENYEVIKIAQILRDDDSVFFWTATKLRASQIPDIPKVIKPSKVTFEKSSSGAKGGNISVAINDSMINIKTFCMFICS